MLGDLSETAGRSGTAERLSVTEAKRASGSKAMSGEPHPGPPGPSASRHKGQTPTDLLKGMPLGRAAQKRLLAFLPARGGGGIEEGVFLKGLPPS